MKQRIAQIVMVLCVFGILIGLTLPQLTSGGPSQNGTARTETRQLEAALNQYHLEFREYPRGDNARILKTLLGENSKKIMFFNANPKKFNSRGEYLDPWKNPYKFQLIGETNVVVLSSGPDSVFGNKDDITNAAQ